VVGAALVQGPAGASQRLSRMAGPPVAAARSRCSARAGNDQAVLAGKRHGLRLPQDHRRPAGSGRGNKAWVTDISYIHTHEGWLSLAVVPDLFCRQAIGWSMSERMTSDLALSALLMAVWRRKPRTSSIQLVRR
jgi:transposase InsO family protein